MADASSDHDTISLSTSCRLDSSLQNILKRVSREIHVRKTGRNDTKQPLPPLYERIGNSIAHQLLLQPHAATTATLINSIYPALKGLEDKMSWLFTDYLEKFDTALKKKATPNCLHPPDIPSIHFLSELCVHTASLPEKPDNHLIPNPALWMEILAIFSASPQNQQVLIDYRCPSKIVGCMNLTNMADNHRLQCHGWRILSNIINVPTPEGKKPGIHIQAITLLLSHVKRQLEQFSHLSDLTSAILTFIINLSTTVRMCSESGSYDPESRPLPYDPDYANSVLQLFEDFCLRKVLLDLPEHVKDYEGVESMLQAIHVALTPSTNSHKQRRAPPPKPKRSKCRTQLFSGLSTSSLPSVDIMISQSVQNCPKLLPVHSKTIVHSKSTENINIIKDIPVVQYDAELSLPGHLLTRTGTKPTQANEPSSSLSSYPSSPSLYQSSLSSIPLILCDSTLVQSLDSSHNLATTGLVNQTLGQDDTDGGEGSTRPQSNGMSGAEQALSNATSNNSQNKQPQPLSRRETYLKAVTASQVKYGSSHEETQTTEEDAKERELLDNVCKLWSANRPLHAASSATLACFVDSTANLTLFTECLTHFCSKPNNWTQGAAIILLPSLREVIKSEPKVSHARVVYDTLTTMLQHCVHRNGTKVSIDDGERVQVFHHELYLLFSVANKVSRLSNDKELQHELISLASILKPFANPT